MARRVGIICACGCGTELVRNDRGHVVCPACDAAAPGRRHLIDTGKRCAECGGPVPETMDGTYCSYSCEEQAEDRAAYARSLPPCLPTADDPDVVIE